jgi:hypothetical protein
VLALLFYYLYLSLIYPFWLSGGGSGWVSAGEQIFICLSEILLTLPVFEYIPTAKGQDYLPVLVQESEINF